MNSSSDYTDELRKIKSLLIVASLQERKDLKALKRIKDFSGQLDWSNREGLMIENNAWNSVTVEKGYDPKLVFCHPSLIMVHREASLYYRCLCGLSIKAAKSYIGAIENIERGNLRSQFLLEKATKMAQTYNTLICTIINNSSKWTLDNGYRTIIATLGITIDGTMRNRIGDIAEGRIRVLLVEWLLDKELIQTPKISLDEALKDMPSEFDLKKGISMIFGSEPDVSFTDESGLRAVVEIKGGIDPAGALERYGAAKKSFEHSISLSSQCQTYLLSAVYTPELTARIETDRLVGHHFDIIEILSKPETKELFCNELFHHTLRIT